MLLAAVLIDALHPALENGVVAFNRIRVDVHASLAVRIAVFLASGLQRRAWQTPCQDARSGALRRSSHGFRDLGWRERSAERLLS